MINLFLQSMNFLLQYKTLIRTLILLKRLLFYLFLKLLFEGRWHSFINKSLLFDCSWIWLLILILVYVIIFVYFRTYHVIFWWLRAWYIFNSILIFSLCNRSNFRIFRGFLIHNWFWRILNFNIILIFQTIFTFGLTFKLIIFFLNWIDIIQKLFWFIWITSFSNIINYLSFHSNLLFQKFYIILKLLTNIKLLLQ